MKKETVNLLTVEQDQALRANYIKNKTERQDVSLMNRLFGEREGTVSHVTARNLLKNSKRTGDTIRFPKSLDLVLMDNSPEAMMENDQVKLLGMRDFKIQTDLHFDHNRPEKKLHGNDKIRDLRQTNMSPAHYF